MSADVGFIGLFGVDEAVDERCFAASERCLRDRLGLDEVVGFAQGSRKSALTTRPTFLRCLCGSFGVFGCEATTSLGAGVRLTEPQTEQVFCTTWPCGPDGLLRVASVRPAMAGTLHRRQTARLTLVSSRMTAFLARLLS